VHTVYTAACKLAKYSGDVLTFFIKFSDGIYSEDQTSIFCFTPEISWKYEAIIKM
jgi:hypothetical protein